MREQQVENVSDVSQRSQQVRSELKQHSGNGMSGVLHLPQPPILHWYNLNRWISLTWENLVVAGREIKGFVIPQWAAGVLLAAIVSAFAFMYMQNQAQRELLIRLDQRLSDKKENDDAQFMKLDNRFNSVDAWQQVTNKELLKIQLTQNQQEERRNAN